MEDDRLTWEFVEFVVNKRKKEIWQIVQLYLLDKSIPYYDLLNFMQDKDRIRKAIEKLRQITQGEDNLKEWEGKDIGKDLTLQQISDILKQAESDYEGNENSGNENNDDDNKDDNEKGEED